MHTLLWFRGKDLRIADHEPLLDAVAEGPVTPVFVLDPYFFDPKRAKQLPHRMQYLLDALGSLAKNLEAKGASLLLAEGKSVDVIPALAHKLRADRVVAQRWVEPFARERDRRVKAELGERFTLFEGETLITPGTLRNSSGDPFSVYTAFARAARAVLAQHPPKARRAPAHIPAAEVKRPHSAALPSLEDLGLTRNEEVIEGGEREARQRFSKFLSERIVDYGSERDRMDHEGTSRMSADVKFGTLSVREAYARVVAHEDCARNEEGGARKFASELLWREFTHHLLWDRPQLLERPFRADFEGFPWREDDSGFDAWRWGQTGFPIVDASARQLLHQGWVHNRARMISASFLTKHLLVHYQRGEAHYLEYLVDGDWAQNNAGWQWSAGCGVDAQPYFRVFNPMTQGKKFDPDGAYVRRWVPELAKLPAKHIHEPWTAPRDVLAKAGVELGRTYPKPIVDHAEARQRFLDVAAAHLKAARTE